MKGEDPSIRKEYHRNFQISILSNYSLISYTMRYDKHKTGIWAEDSLKAGTHQSQLPSHQDML